MKTRAAFIATLCLVLLPAAPSFHNMSAASLALAQGERRCFSETGECLEGEFRRYWEQNGGLPVFGYPVTPARPEIDPASNAIFLTQWFERNRFELHPENQPPYRVLLGRLGDVRLRQTGRDPLTLPRASSMPHYFPETGHAIAAQFWDYWRDHGLDMGDAGTSQRESLALFGYPITEAQMEPAANGQQVLTQWFERARFEHHPNNPEPHRVLLGLLGNEMKVASARQGLDRLNYYRQQVGSPPVEQHPSLVVSAQSHANYLVLNGAGSNPHVQVAGRQGYTGAGILERVQAAGYSYSSGYRVSNVLVPIEDPSASIDALIDLPLHRVIVLNTDFRQVGHGRAALAADPARGRNNRIAYSVVDLGTGPLDTMPVRAPYVMAYPIDRQSGVPASWNYLEFPNPLPAGATLPAGYPFTLQGAYGPLRVDHAEMRDNAGQVVAVHPSTAHCREAQYNCYMMIPVAPLKANTTYSVHARGAVGSVTFERTWQFTTGTTGVPRR
ncbi:MAG TPA: CAP domain-containing protein [Chloroflexia bacterium]|jgi:hypothetical protein